jgi:hypothetical protein
VMKLWETFNACFIQPTHLSAGVPALLGVRPESSD